MLPDSPSSHHWSWWTIVFRNTDVTLQFRIGSYENRVFFEGDSLFFTFGILPVKGILAHVIKPQGAWQLTEAREAAAGCGRTCRHGRVTPGHSALQRFSFVLLIDIKPAFCLSIDCKTTTELQHNMTGIESLSPPCAVIPAHCLEILKSS